MCGGRQPKYPTRDGRGWDDPTSLGTHVIT